MITYQPAVIKQSPPTRGLHSLAGLGVVGHSEATPMKVQSPTVQVTESRSREAADNGDMVLYFTVG